VSNSARVRAAERVAHRRLANFLDVAGMLSRRSDMRPQRGMLSPERIGSGIGTAFHYFPRQAIMAFALLNPYARRFEAMGALDRTAETLPYTVAEAFLEASPNSYDERPACLQLCRADPVLPVIRCLRAFARCIANAFRAKNPSLPMRKYGGPQNPRSRWKTA